LLEERVHALVTSTTVDGVVDNRGDSAVTHSLSGSEGSTTSKGEASNDTNDNTSNSTSSDGGGSDDGVGNAGTIGALIASIALADQRDVSSRVGRRIRRQWHGVVYTLAVSSAVVWAGRGHKLGRDEARGHVDLRRGSTRSASGAIGILSAFTSGEGSSSAGSLTGAPTAEEAVGTRSIDASSAVVLRELSTSFLLGDSDVASSTSEVRSAISAKSALASSTRADTVTAAVQTIVEATVSDIVTRAASNGVGAELGVTASAGTSSLIASSVTTAEAGARDNNALAIASDEVALRIGGGEGGNKAALVEGIRQLGSWELDEGVGVVSDSTGGEAEPSVRVVLGQGVEVALLASRASETTRASSRGNNASLSDVTTNPGLVTIVYGELEAVAVYGVEVEEIEIPHDLSTIGIDGGLNVSRVDESDGERVRTSTKVPASASRVPVGARISGGADVEVIGAEGVGSRECLSDRLPETANLLRGISLTTLLPISNTSVVVSGDVSPEEGRGDGATTGHGTSRILSAVADSGVTVDVRLGVVTVEVPHAKLEVGTRDAAGRGRRGGDSVGSGNALSINNGGDTQGHRVLVRVEELKLAALNLERVQDLVLVEVRGGTVGRSVRVAE